MKTSIFDSLERLQLTSLETRTKISSRTRDMDSLSVWKDNVSGVIYIDDFYTGEETYLDGAYREEEKIRLQAGKRSISAPRIMCRPREQFRAGGQPSTWLPPRDS